MARRPDIAIRQGAEPPSIRSNVYDVSSSLEGASDITSNEYLLNLINQIKGRTITPENS